MKRILGTIMASVILIGCLLGPVISVRADEQYPLLKKGHATAYIVSGTTASGSQTRNGICAGAKEYLGCVIVIYQRLPDNSLGDYIGTYECLDTGGTDGLKNGTVIDVWQPNSEAVQEFMNTVYENDCQGKIYIQVIEGKG